MRRARITKRPLTAHQEVQLPELVVYRRGTGVIIVVEQGPLDLRPRVTHENVTLEQVRSIVTVARACGQAVTVWGIDV